MIRLLAGDGDVVLGWVVVEDADSVDSLDRKIEVSWVWMVICVASAWLLSPVFFFL